MEYQLDIEYAPLFTPLDVPAKLKPTWTLRDYQQNIFTFLTEESPDDNRSRMVSLYTGGGKTLCALAASSHIGYRTVIVLLPTYCQKWGGDIVNTLDISPKQVMIIQGSNALKGLITAAKEETLDVSYIIISIRTLQNFYKAYETNRHELEENGYDCQPDELFETLQTGTLIIDETHQHLHAVYKLLAYTHVHKVIALSATFMSDDPMINKIQHTMFPKEIRYDKVKMDKYIKVYAIAYSFNYHYRNKIKSTERGSNTYSHTAFEKSILKTPTCLEGYLDLINYIVKIGYIDDYQKGDKLAVYAASIAMCTAITDYLKAVYPNFDVRRYVERDPYENVIDADIRVTTVLSAGTAVDIPNLRCVVMTNNILSPVANLQSLGRLRKLPDRDVKFYYLYCLEIKKHKMFHNRRKDLFADRVVGIKELHYPYLV